MNQLNNRTLKLEQVLYVVETIAEGGGEYENLSPFQKKWNEYWNQVHQTAKELNRVGELVNVVDEFFGIIPSRDVFEYSPEVTQKIAEIVFFQLKVAKDNDLMPEGGWSVDNNSDFDPDNYPDASIF